MAPSITIAPLARHQEHLPLLASWFLQQWPAWYGPGGRGNAQADLHSFAESELVLPVGLIIFRDGVPVGVGALKAESIPTHKNLSPWAAAGFVLPACRGSGIGSLLLEALVRQACALGYSRVYCGTGTAVSLLRRCGWSELERVEHEGEALVVFQKSAV